MHSDLELVPTGQPVSPSSPATPLEIRSNGNKPWDGCKFTTADRLNTLFCSGCQALHSIRAFSKQQMRLGEDERICIGREGVFRLCKHEYVQWSDIEDHFLQQHGQPGTRSRLVPTTSQMRCEHPSHLGDGSHKLLLQDELPRLVLEGSCTSNYKITRVWERHHSFPLGDSQGGRFCPSAVRSRLRDDLSNAAGEIISGGHSTTTAALNKAMRCFASPSCSCLHYGNYGDGGVAQTQPKGFFDCHDSDSKTKHTSHNPVSVNPCDWDSETIQVTRCLETQLEDQPSRGCVVVRYKRVLSGLAGLTHTTERNEPDVPIVPPHEWFHALDPDSYEMEDHPVVVGNVWPACRDVACGNYYATRQVTHCNNRTHF
ncbi:hypothetical protein QBC41DRAFT_336108 [Cercophora samala]|uniref:Uncharacterized protein n=1 Tax=Cercophora samala TaxID=330535 RepID=A0AA40DE27_9PEZI|nr:hypothetical protein QBC41DRAFT_336108 [Cercophora samala]